MNLVLIGYRGTGKSHIGWLLSLRLQMPCLSLDQEVEKLAGMSITEIVAKDGWQEFRDLESEVVRQLTATDEVILDTGGGVIERPENVDLLKKNSCVVWLKARLETVVARISSGSHRPALTDGKSFTEEVAEVLARRNPIYHALADFEVDTDDQGPDEVADRIVELWNNFRSNAANR